MHGTSFRTAWFIESITTQILVIFVIRTWGWTWNSRPDRVLATTSLVTLGVAIAIALTPLGRAVGFTTLPVSLLVTIAVYPVLRDPTAEYVMFSFPELTFCVMGVLVWIGGYTGYRLLDLVRFRSFAGPGSGPA